MTPPKHSPRNNSSGTNSSQSYVPASFSFTSSSFTAPITLTFKTSNASYVFYASQGQNVTGHYQDVLDFIVTNNKLSTSILYNSFPMSQDLNKYTYVLKYESAYGSCSFDIANKDSALTINFDLDFHSVDQVLTFIVKNNYFSTDSSANSTVVNVTFLPSNTEHKIYVSNSKETVQDLMDFIHDNKECYSDLKNIQWDSVVFPSANTQNGSQLTSILTTDLLSDHQSITLVF